MGGFLRDTRLRAEWSSDPSAALTDQLGYLRSGVARKQVASLIHACARRRLFCVVWRRRRL